MAVLESFFKAPEPQQASGVLELVFSKKPNAALALPKGVAPPDGIKFPVLQTELYGAQPETIMDEVAKAISATEDVTKSLPFGSDQGCAHIVRTAIMRFPDLCYVTLEAENSSADAWRLYLYSHSVYGYSDIGANAKRIGRILQALEPHRAVAI